MILFSIKIFVSGEADVQKILFNQREAEFNASNDQEIEDQIASINEKLVKINSFYENKNSFIEVLEKISNCIPSEIYLTNISINPLAKTGSEMKISISGFAPNREKLLELKVSLEAEKSFSKIDIPSFNWLKPTDINFSISFIMQ